jgi:hypothetical protein
MNTLVNSGPNSKNLDTFYPNKKGQFSQKPSHATVSFMLPSVSVMDIQIPLSSYRYMSKANSICIRSYAEPISISDPIDLSTKPNAE